jgi:hypothetical protein
VSTDSRDAVTRDDQVYSDALPSVACEDRPHRPFVVSVCRDDGQCPGSPGPGATQEAASHGPRLGQSELPQVRRRARDVSATIAG